MSRREERTVNPGRALGVERDSGVEYFFWAEDYITPGTGYGLQMQRKPAFPSRLTTYIHRIYSLARECNGLCKRLFSKKKTFVAGERGTREFKLGFGIWEQFLIFFSEIVGGLGIGMQTCKGSYPYREFKTSLAQGVLGSFLPLCSFGRAKS